MFRNRAEVERIFREEYGKTLYTKPADDVRLLKLEIWATRYHVSLRYVIVSLCEVWRKRFTKFDRVKTLGIGIPLLTGRRSQQILQELILKNFPDNQNEHEWKWKRKQEQLDADEADEAEVKVKGLLDMKSPLAFVKCYRRRVEARRQDFDNATADKSRKSRAYRNNPWL